MLEPEDDERIKRIETRLDQIWRFVQNLAADAPRKVTPPVEQSAPVQSSRPAPPVTPPQPVRATAPAAARRDASEDAGLSVTTLLGWAGVTAMVLAAAYLISLAIDSGWLTPIRQIGLAVLSGLGLIAAGAALRR